jgi:DNA-binding transcriptional MerR regulator
MIRKSGNPPEPGMHAMPGTSHTAGREKGAALSPPESARADFPISEVAAMVGLSPDTIRAWERRYGLLSPIRARNNRRRYTLEDVQALIRVKGAASVSSLSLRLAAVELEQGDLADLLLPSAAAPGSEQDGYEPDVWRSAVDLLPQLVLVVDDRGQIADVNMALARATGMLRSQLRQLRFVDIVDPYDQAKAVKTYRSVAAERRYWELNLEIGRLVGLYSFDCWAVRFRGQRLFLLVGNELGRAYDDIAPGGRGAS